MKRESAKSTSNSYFYHLSHFMCAYDKLIFQGKVENWGNLVGDYSLFRYQRLVSEMRERRAKKRSVQFLSLLSFTVKQFNPRNSNEIPVRHSQHLNRLKAREIVLSRREKSSPSLLSYLDNMPLTEYFYYLNEVHDFSYDLHYRHRF